MQKIENHTIPSPEYVRAREIFRPSQFGFRDLRNDGIFGWEKEIPNIGAITFAPLTAAHARLDSVSSLLIHMQQTSFNITNTHDTLPTNLLGIPHILVAYRNGEFTKEGCAGFATMFGGKRGHGKLSSKALGIMPDYQGINLGWYFRILQAHTALEEGFETIEWSYNPTKKPNAKLFIAKLGGEGVVFTPKKEGLLDSNKGKPSDKVTIRWNLVDPHVHQRITTVNSCISNNTTYRGFSFANFNNPPNVVLDNLNQIAETQPDTVLCRFPTKEDLIVKEGEELSDGEKNLRKIFSTLLDTEDAEYPNDAERNPASVREYLQPGSYTIRDVVSDNGSMYYVLIKKSILYK